MLVGGLRSLNIFIGPRSLGQPRKCLKQTEPGFCGKNHIEKTFFFVILFHFGKWLLGTNNKFNGTPLSISGPIFLYSIFFLFRKESRKKPSKAGKKALNPPKLHYSFNFICNAPLNCFFLKLV